MRDIFYNVQDLPMKTKKAILLDAKAECYKWFVDILDCRVSWDRQPIEMPFDEIMKKFDGGCAFVIIHRCVIPGEPEHIEFGFRTMRGEPEDFLWIEVEPDKGNKILAKYNLTQMQ